MTEINKNVEVKENAAFTEHLKTIDSILKKHGVEYSLVGGLALKAIFGENVPARRDNESRSIHDFDAVAFGPDQETIDKALKEIRQIKKGQKNFPPVGVEPIRFSDRGARYSPLSYLSTMRKDSQGRYFLAYSNIEVEVPAETMVVKDQTLNGISLPVFSEKTIFWRFFTRGGAMKIKDEEKLRQLHFHIINNGITQPEDNLYEPYFNFIKQINEKYPFRIRLWNYHWNNDQRSGGRISGSRALEWTIGVLRK